jgi:hypothetical protein
MKARSYDTIDKMSTSDILSDVDSMIHVLDRRDIVVLKKKNIIKVYTDKSCSMAIVEVNGDHLMTGNYHDFHPGCHGGRLRVLGYMMGRPDWQGYTSLVRLVTDYIMQIANSLATSRLHSDTTVEVRYFEAKYCDDGEWRKAKWDKNRK